MNDIDDAETMADAEVNKTLSLSLFQQIFNMEFSA